MKLVQVQGNDFGDGWGEYHRSINIDKCTSLDFDIIDTHKEFKVVIWFNYKKLDEVGDPWVFAFAEKYDEANRILNCLLCDIDDPNKLLIAPVSD